ncbi:uncharacterized protein N7500_010518 [Penicillium coprophilum]|uniref:uncharacterized protein n=1 Tax=Penicillium coprophilum TaxID=36646 RepID=UPI00239304F7|nr:uncharacterized protein N7500_010518 [Penicillium coprophilum]KAJ5155079.1 hypothetical protein N7500_010518 [Penicillium coprophilum]
MATPWVATIDESQTSASVSTPRTSRSHLLAGLRTAPKSATIPSEHQQRSGMESSRFTGYPNRGTDRVPQTATGTGFPQHNYTMSQNANSHRNSSHHNRMMYTMPEQVLAPPMLEMAGDDIPIDENMYAELMSTNLFLAAQQQRLQQQLISVTAAAQQFQGLNLGMSLPRQQQMPSLSIPGMGFYQQQLQQGVQPIVQPVPGQPGMFCVYNPLTGQQSYIMDNNSQEDHQQHFYQDNQSHIGQQVPQFRAEISPPADSMQSPMQFPQPISPQLAAPRPPMSRLRTSILQRPMWDPGLGLLSCPRHRPLEHLDPVKVVLVSIRCVSPVVPPSLEDLVAKPTSKHEGSKNFATRQRRRAVHNLVRAGIERRGDTRSFGYHSSGGTNTPASEKEFTFSDGDDATVRSGGSLSSKPSLGSLRAVANGAIGSERREKSGRDRKSPDSPFHSATPTSEDGGYFCSKFVDARGDYVPSPSASGTSSPSVASVVAGQGPAAQAPERRKMPMLVLSSAEKRKTTFM